MFTNTTTHRRARNTRRCLCESWLRACGRARAFLLLLLSRLLLRLPFSSSSKQHECQSQVYSQRNIYSLYKSCVLKLITIKQKPQEFLSRVRARLLGLCSRHFFSTGRCPRAYSSDSNSTFLIKHFLTHTHTYTSNI